MSTLKPSFVGTDIERQGSIRAKETPQWENAEQGTLPIGMAARYDGTENQWESRHGLYSLHRADRRNGR